MSIPRASADRVTHPTRERATKCDAGVASGRSLTVEVRAPTALGPISAVLPFFERGPIPVPTAV